MRGVWCTDSDWFVDDLNLPVLVQPFEPALDSDSTPSVAGERDAGADHRMVVDKRGAGVETLRNMLDFCTSVDQTGSPITYFDDFTSSMTRNI